ncbi:tetratricopeptide (TPR) repeat protein [Oxalobacteraceae bacterium GrIS 2.11]
MIAANDSAMTQLAERMAQQRRLSFGSFSEAQGYLAAARNEIDHALQESSVLLAKGLAEFAALDRYYVSALCFDLLEHIGQPLALAEICEARVVHNDTAYPQFMDAMNYFYDCGDLEREQSAIAVLMLLFPTHPQPYVYQGTLIWRKDGIAAAERFYIEMVEMMEDPALDYFAAECFYEIGSIDKARDVLRRAQINTNMSPTMYAEIRERIAVLMGRCNSITVVR